MSVDPAPASPRRLIFALGIFVGCTLLVLGAASTRRWRDLGLARGEAARLEEAIAASRTRSGRLEEEIARLERDEEAIERAARAELGWVREGDRVFVFVEEANGGR